jgi:hypothetical protein
MTSFSYDGMVKCTQKFDKELRENQYLPYGFTYEEQEIFVSSNENFIIKHKRELEKFWEKDVGSRAPFYDELSFLNHIGRYFYFYYSLILRLQRVQKGLKFFDWSDPNKILIVNEYNDTYVYTQSTTHDLENVVFI